MSTAREAGRLPRELTAQFGSPARFENVDDMGVTRDTLGLYSRQLFHGQDQAGRASEVTAIVPLHLPRHRAAIEAHYAALSAEDRRMRFCCTVSRESVAHYLDGLQASGAASYGIFNPVLELVAIAQFGENDPPGHDLEVGLSVLGPYRRQGLAAALLQRAASYARSRGLQALVIHCLAENGPMLSLARRLGMQIETLGGEADGRLKLSAATALDYWHEIAYDHGGIADAVAKRWQLAMQGALGPGVPAKDRNH